MSELPECLKFCYAFFLQFPYKCSPVVETLSNKNLQSFLMNTQLSLIPVPLGQKDKKTWPLLTLFIRPSSCFGPFSSSLVTAQREMSSDFHVNICIGYNGTE